MEEIKKFIAKEEVQQGSIGFTFFKKYIFSMQGSKIFGPIILILISVASIGESLFRYIVSLWIDNCSKTVCSQNIQAFSDLKIWLQHSNPAQITFFFFSFCFITIIIKALDWIVLIGFLSNGARVLHDQMVESFSNVRVTFLDEHPSGRLIRRFSGDYIQAKDEIPNIFADILGTFIELIVITVIVLIQTPFAIFSILPCMYFYFRIQKIFKSASREIQRLAKVLETPIWSLFSESVVGYQTIRAYGKTDEFITKLNAIAKDFAKASLLQSRILRWLNIRLKVTSEFFTLTITIIAITFVAHGKIGIGQAGFLMSLTIGLDSVMQWLTRSLSMIEAKMVSIERIVEYKNLPSEHSSTTSINDKIRNNWPQNGEVKILNLTGSYRNDLPIILNKLSVTFPAGKKIGIIGKTGAGKSTLFQALYRMIYFHAGEILVDGVNILNLPLEKSREIFAIVPQEPHLFSGSLRYNLDRTNKYTDTEIWTALKDVQLAEYIINLPGKLQYELTEKGANFSVGQRQLICMARAILSKAKIILMDEATASVDLETEKLIQLAIQKAFADKTTIVIAHRLETLKSADHVVLLGNGTLLDYGSPENILAKLGKELQTHLT